jgi:hypothetical protein
MLKNRNGRVAIAVLSSTAAVVASLAFTAAPASATASPLAVQVTKLNVSKGSTLTDSNVLVTGKGFLYIDTTSAASVTIGGVNAASFMVLSDTQLAATIVKAAAATVDVLVTGVVATVPVTSAISTGDKFTFLAPYDPTLSAVSLNPLGGSKFTVTSSVAWGTTAALFAAEKVTATVGGATATLKWLTSTTATVTAPAGTPNDSFASVVLLHNGVVSTTPDTTHALYVSVITKLSVTSGPVGGGGSVIVTGKGLLGSTAWKFGAISTTCVVNSDVKVTCPVPDSGAVVGSVVSVSLTPRNGTSGTPAPITYGTTSGASYTYSDIA